MSCQNNPSVLDTPNPVPGLDLPPHASLPIFLIPRQNLLWEAHGLSDLQYVIPTSLAGLEMFLARLKYDYR